jgi:hypothetical protein
MIPIDIATLATVGLLLAIGATLFAIKLSLLFRGSAFGEACRTLVLAFALWSTTSALELFSALGGILLPEWWRDGLSVPSRLIMVYGLYQIYIAWSRLDR